MIITCQSCNTKYFINKKILGENGKISTSKKVLKQIAEELDYDVVKLLAAGDAVGDDIEKIITKTPTAVPEFLRTAKNLTEEEWRSLTKQVKNMNKKKK